jgi:hypothetical protein
MKNAPILLCAKSAFVILTTGINFSAMHLHAFLGVGNL